jgi:hypothetical protein
MSTNNFPGVTALLLIALYTAGPPGRAQQSLPVPEHQSSALSTEAVLRQMTQTAGVVFAGEVVAVRRPVGFAGSGQDAAEGVVTIEFRVDQAVRGPGGGSIYTVREWAGLWTGGDRYRVGQRLLVFLQAPGRNGLSSPVGGKAGVVPLRGGGQAPGPYDARTGPSDWLADLRWVQAQALREGGSVEGTESNPVLPARPIRDRPRAYATADGTASIVTDPFLPVPGHAAHWTALPLASGSATQTLSEVLGLCRGWVRVPDGAL